MTRPRLNSPRRRLLLGGGLGLGLGFVTLPPVAWAQLPTNTSDPAASPRWQAIRASLFGERRIEAAAGVLELSAPARAVDASAVPLAVRSAPGAEIRRLWLIIDANPSPIAAILAYHQAGARPDVETRVRIDEYSFVRAVAELGDGRLVMAARHVKASGGCSAPPDKDPAEAQANLGRMAWRLEGTPHRGQPALVSLSISHPNDTGMVMDQV
ncbi:MAG: hypothetical protein RL722_856, partial [Pseudomonadota bacterium]